MRSVIRKQTAVALISGGKDSISALCASLCLGFKFVAVAHITYEDGAQEVDSYMYQSVAPLEVIEKIAECLHLPLISQTLRGKPLQTTSNDYTEVNGDEVEDLTDLLKQVKERFPEVQFVCNGAILSRYQKLRLENVCTRLNLTPLSPLWNFPQRALLHMMTSIPDLDVRIIKIATLGLKEKHLGRTLKEIAAELFALADKYGVHCCGEGGEFETITLDCPAFQEQRIVVNAWETVIHSADDFAPVAYLRLPRNARERVSLTPKTQTTVSQTVPNYEGNPNPDITQPNFFPPFDAVMTGDYFCFDMTGTDIAGFHQRIEQELERDTAEVAKTVVLSPSANDLLPTIDNLSPGADNPPSSGEEGTPSTISLDRCCEFVRNEWHRKWRHILAEITHKSPENFVAAAITDDKEFYGCFPWDGAREVPSLLLAVVLAMRDLRNFLISTHRTFDRVAAIHIVLSERWTKLGPENFGNRSAVAATSIATTNQAEDLDRYLRTALQIIFSCNSVSNEKSPNGAISEQSASMTPYKRLIDKVERRQIRFWQLKGDGETADDESVHSRDQSTKVTTKTLNVESGFLKIECKLIKAIRT